MSALQRARAALSELDGYSVEAARSACRAFVKTLTPHERMVAWRWSQALVRALAEVLK